MRWPSIVACAALLLGACGSGDQGSVAGEDYGRMQADNIALGVTHYVTAEGVRQAVLKADTAYIFEDSARVELRKVHLTLYHESGREAADLTSATGELNTRTEAMVARGNVVLIARDGSRRIETEELHFHPQEDRIWSDVATTYVEGGTTLRGDGFTSDGQLRNIQLRRPRGQTGDRIEF